MARPRGHYLNPDRFDDYLPEKGTTLTAVAESAGITRASLSGLVAQNHAASVPVAHKLAQNLGVNVGSLFPSLAARWAGRVDQAAA